MVQISRFLSSHGLCPLAVLLACLVGTASTVLGSEINESSGQRQSDTRSASDIEPPHDAHISYEDTVALKARIAAAGSVQVRKVLTGYRMRAGWFTRDAYAVAEADLILAAIPDAVLRFRLSTGEEVEPLLRDRRGARFDSVVGHGSWDFAVIGDCCGELWSVSLADGEIRAHIPRSRGPASLQQVRAFPDGTGLAAIRGGTLEILDPSTLATRQAAPRSASEPAALCGFDSNGSVVAASRDGGLYAWNVPANDLTELGRITGSSPAVCELSSNGKLVAVVMPADHARFVERSELILYRRADDTALTTTLSERAEDVRLLFAHDENVLLVGTGTGVHAWHLAATPRRFEFAALHAADIRSLQLVQGAAGPPNVLSVDESGVMSVWQYGSEIGERARALNGRVSQMAISADGRWMVAGNDAGDIALWDLSHGVPTALLDGVSEPLCWTGLETGRSICAAPSREPRTTEQSDLIWDRWIGGYAAPSRQSPVHAIAVSRDGSRLRIVQGHHDLIEYQVPGLLRIGGYSLGTQRDAANRSGLSRYGDFIFSRVMRTSSTDLVLSATAGGQRSCSWRGPEDRSWGYDAPYVASDGRFVVHRFDSKPEAMQVWFPACDGAGVDESGRNYLFGGEDLGYAKAVTHDERIIAVRMAGDPAVQLWALGTEEAVFLQTLTTEIRDPIWTGLELMIDAHVEPPVAISADGELVATGSRGGYVHVWSTTTGTQVGYVDLSSVDDKASALVFDRRNGTLFVGTARGAILLLDIEPTSSPAR